MSEFGGDNDDFPAIERPPYRTLITDAFGFIANVTPMRELKVTGVYRVVGASFEAAIDTAFWTAATSGAGAASGVANGMATISSGTANSGYGKLSSVQIARFQFAHPLQFRAAIRLTDTTIAENTRRWGAYTTSTVTPQNGVYFEVDAAGALTLNTVSGTSVTSVSSGNFNGDVTSFTMDTDVHAYEIVYFTMGVWFCIDNVFIHEIIPTTAVIAEVLSTPLNVTSVNSGSGTTSGTIEFWNGVIIKLGRSETAPVSFYQNGMVADQALKEGAGTLHSIAVSAVANNSVITLFDNTAASGTVLWTSGSMGAQTIPISIDLQDVPFFTGLTLAITTQDADATVIYE